MNKPYFIALCFVMAFLASLVVVPVLGANLSFVPWRQIEPGQATAIEPNGQVGGIAAGLAVQGDYAFFGLGPRLLVINLAPNSPTFDYLELAGKTEILPNVVRDVVVGDGYAYVAAGAGGLQVIDIADPTTPRVVGSFAVGENVTVLKLVGHTLYVGDAGPTGLHVIDVTTPTAPRELGAIEWRAGIWEMTVVGNYVYVADGYDLFIFDVSDSSAPKQIGHVGTECSTYDVAVLGSLAYIADNDYCGLLIADVTDPAVQTSVVYADPQDVFYLNPLLRSSNQRTTYLIEIVDNYAYVVTLQDLYPDGSDPIFNNYLTVYDLSNPRLPELVNDFDLEQADPTVEITDMTVTPGFVYLSDAAGHLLVVNVTDLRVVGDVDYTGFLGPVIGVAADDDRVFAADPPALYYGIDGTAPELNPTEQLRVSPDGQVMGWVGSAGLGYLTTNDEVILFDLVQSNPTMDPVELATYTPSDSLFWTALDNTTLYLFYSDAGRIYVVDATAPNTARELGSAALPEELLSNPTRVVVNDGLAFLFFFQSPPYMLDLRAGAPEPLGFLGDAPANSVAVIDDIAYVAAAEAGLRRYDLTDPHRPRLLAALPGPTTAREVLRVDNTLFVDDATGLLHVFDATPEDGPVSVAVLSAPYLNDPASYTGRLQIETQLKSIALLDDQVLVAAGDSGLWRYPVSGLRLPGTGSALEFDNFPLSEATLLYIDDATGDLTLENVDTGVKTRLSNIGNVNGYSLSPLRDHVLYSDAVNRSYLLSLEFRSDGRLRVEQVAEPFRVPYVSGVTWSPDGTWLDYVDEQNRPWTYSNATLQRIALPDEILAFGGWSYDRQWLAYCSADRVLKIVQPGGEPIAIDDDMDCAPIMGDWFEWSPTALQMAYTRGQGDGLTTLGRQLTVYDVATQSRYDLPPDNTIMAWSPDGRFLALGNGSVGMRSFSYNSFTIVNPLDGQALPLPGADGTSLGSSRWRQMPSGDLLFDNQRIASDLSAAEPVAEILLNVAPDGKRWITGRMAEGVLEVFCGTQDRPYEFSLYLTGYPSYPDEYRPVWFEPGVYASLSPRGNYVTLYAYQGGEEWQTRLLPCDPAIAMPLTEPTVWEDRASASFSADERWFILNTPDSDGDGRVITLHDARNGTATPRTGELAAWTWLVSATVAPPVTQVNVIAGQATDHTGVPVAGVTIRAADNDTVLETTTGSDGSYRLEDVPAGHYEMSATLANHSFTSPPAVTAPPSQMGVDFVTQAPPTNTLNGRVTDCSGQPVAGVAIAYDSGTEPLLTDADGRYTFVDLERRAYDLTATAEGLSFLPARRRVDLTRYTAGEILTVDFTAVAPGAADPCISHLEVIQVVQDEFNSAPMIAHKPALLRAYLHCGACGASDTIRGTLEAFRPDDGTAIPAPGAPLTARMNKPSTDRIWLTQRAELERSLNFLLPPEWLEGNVRFRVTVDDAVATLDVTFEPGQPLRIYYLPYTYHLPTDPSVPVPVPTPMPIVNEEAISDGYEALVTLLPIARDDLIYLPQTSVRQLIGVPFDQEGSPRMNAERYLDALNAYWLRQQQTAGWWDDQQPDRLVGWVANADQHVALSGIAEPRYLAGGSGAVAAIAIDTSNFLHIEQFSRSGIALVHELGHLLDETGLRHTPFAAGEDSCPAEQADSTATDYPTFTPAGSIGDIGIRIDGNSYQLFMPSLTYDIMSYCEPYWLSLHNYKRFHEGFTLVAEVSAQQPADAPQMLISGRVISSTQTAEFDPLYRVNVTVPPATGGSGAYCVELRDRTEATLEKQCFDLDFRQSITGALTDAAAFNLALPWRDEAVAAVVTHVDQELGRVTASTSGPLLNINYSWDVDAAGDSITMSWEGGDPDGDTLTYNVGLNSRRGYIPLAFNIQEQELTVDAHELPGGETLYIVVEVSDGFHSSTVGALKGLVLPDRQPVVTIRPMPDSIIAERGFWLFGAGSDAEDGALSGETLVWSAGGEELGRGTQLFTRMSAGEHHVLLTATDSAGNSATAEVTLVVAPEDEIVTPRIETGQPGQRWLSWVVIGLGVTLLIGLLFVMRIRRRSVS